MFALYCFACFWSHVFQEACTVSISCQLTVLYTHGQNTWFVHSWQLFYACQCIVLWHLYQDMYCMVRNIVSLKPWLTHHTCCVSEPRVFIIYFLQSWTKSKILIGSVLSGFCRMDRFHWKVKSCIFLVFESHITNCIVLHVT